MVLDSLARAHRYAALHPSFARAFEFLANTDLKSLAPGKHLIDGDRLYVSVDHKDGRGREGARLEAHRSYIDIQFTIDGNEEIGWRPTAECQQPAGEFDEKTDIGFFEDRPTTWLAVRPGRFAIFFPEDAHAPLAGHGLLKKAIVKVATNLSRVVSGVGRTGLAITMAAALIGPGTQPLGAQERATADPRPIRIGLIGVDTSHAGAFTQLLNDPSRPDHVPGARVVAAFKGGSPDVEASATRVEKFAAELRDKWNIDLVDSIDELVRRVDAVMLTSVDGRAHLAQARPVIAARKPLFVDKPFTASVKDAVELARLARESGTPLFSSSSLRFTDAVVAIKRDPRLSEVKGAIAWGPATLEPHHPDLFWYGIHTVEILYTFMGRGCERLTRVHTAGADVVSCQWKDGRIGVLRGIRDGASSYGQVVFGPKAVVSAPPADASGANATRSSYYGLISAVVDFFRTGQSPVPIEDTLEIIAFMEAADLSKARHGAPVTIAEVLAGR